jgi:hypothetical protein
LVVLASGWTVHSSRGNAGAYIYYKRRSFRFKKHATYTLWDESKTGVHAFATEPSSEDLAKIKDELSLAELEIEGQVFTLDNNTLISVMEDNGTGAVKVKIADPNAREKVAWVPRGNIIRPVKQLPG